MTPRHKEARRQSKADGLAAIVLNCHSGI